MQYYFDDQVMLLIVEEWWMTGLQNDVRYMAWESNSLA